MFNVKNVDTYCYLDPKMDYLSATAQNVEEKLIKFYLYDNNFSLNNIEIKPNGKIILLLGLLYRVGLIF